ncbi:Na+/H+ antiporter NhaA [Bifidobacterium stellenboschense]|uniref:Na(+)/H(+) antiporter NhaA n=1 Tax=Bifidobacterium stellenboschense TaxID=762211 RepID=A0A087DPA3_9BIFI|nr:Na+/H+ antiporter NhaA [Bifidobacterium stellenboschense]KFI97353.1 sodium/proton antiporter, NhaA family [Bifidobacterium stellenboschense]
MTSHPPIHEGILEPGAVRIHKGKRRLIRFTHSSTRATMLMVGAALAAFLIENTPALPYFNEFWQSVHLAFSIGPLHADISLEHFINDFLMALFFLMVGLEIKHEMRAGELTEPRKAVLPIVAAAGGAVLPALVYLAVNIGGEHAGGWGVPMANDIAFCLGLLALLGSRVPAGLRAYLSALTIADDMIAIGVIALFYTSDLNLPWLIAALVMLAVLFAFNRLHIHDLPPYLVVGFVMWVCVLFSGVHATLAGVMLALAIPARSEIKLDRVGAWFAKRVRSAEDRYDPGEPDIAQKEYLREVESIRRVSSATIPPTIRLENGLHTFVTFFVLPLFAFSNAGVVLHGMSVGEIVTSPVAIGVFLGLFVGKPLGIFLATWATVRLGVSGLPDGVRWGHIAGVSILGGVGFTMAIFVTNLSFTDVQTAAIAKTAILAASILAGAIGFLVLRRQVADAEEE